MHVIHYNNADHYVECAKKGCYTFVVVGIICAVAAFKRCYNIYFSIRDCGFRQKSSNFILINNYFAHMNTHSQLYGCTLFVCVTRIVNYA